MNVKLDSHLFSFQGIATRGEFATIFVGSVVLWMILWALGGGSSLMSIVALPLMVVLAWIGLASEVRRLHDLGKSGWLVLIGLIPLAGFILLVYLLVAEGGKGAQYEVAASQA